MNPFPTSGLPYFNRAYISISLPVINEKSGFLIDVDGKVTTEMGHTIS